MGMRYMEKVAMDWADKGIFDQESAEDYLNLNVNQYRKIMRYFGITGRNPSEEEQGFMSSWLRKLEMPLDIIKEACNRTVNNTGKASFSYANTILNDWHNAGVKTLAQVKQLDEEYRQKKKKTQKKNEQSGANTFNNYDKRVYDSDLLTQIINSKFEEKD